MAEPRGLTDEEVQAACTAPGDATKEFFLQQTMLRIKDPKKSLDFYTRVMGMRLLKHFDFPDMKFTLYFVGYGKEDEVPTDSHERTQWTFHQRGVLELTHNYGTENDPDFKYHNGNSEPRGYGHIGFAVDDVDAACERFDKLGVQFAKRPNEGKMKNLAFIKDPDGYMIEILSPKTIVDIVEPTKKS